MSLYWNELESYVPPNVLINADNDVVYFSSNAAQYLRIPGGTLTHDLTRLFNEPLRSQLLESLCQIQQGRETWNSQPLEVPTEHGIRRITLRVKQLQSGLKLVVMDDRHSAAPGDATGADEHVAPVGETHSRGNGSGLPAASRIGAASEQLRQVQEELATSHEELQAVGEELVTLEQENQRRVHELTQVSMDLQHLLASTGIATLFLDRELRIVRFTPLLGAMFGLRLPSTAGPVTDFTLLARYDEFEADARQVLHKLEPLEREVAGDQGRWYLSRLLPYRIESGQVEGVVLSLIDITERKRAEQALLNANRNKDQFLAVLAHELRNPLAPISAGVEVLKAASHDPATVEHTAQTMGRQTRQLVRLVEDLLEVSRISGGKLQLRTAPLDLREVIQDAIAGAQASIEGAGHTLEVDIPAQAVCVNGDAARLVQVLSNLLNNAVRYTPRPGKISVSAALEEGQVVVAVKDTGVGISGDALEDVFQMFYQGREGAERGAGLGIGLTLAKTLVEMHGGSISVHSGGEDQGSEFKVQLPLATPAEPARASAPEERNQASPPVDHRILIIDDNVDAAETLCTLMKSLGQQEVYTASSGAQALQSAPELHPDIVLLDLMMPGMDGFEVARRIRRESWGKQLLLVALSGWGHEEHRRRTKEAGFDRHVTKPADLAAIRAVLREARPQA
jgi:PAS domain S-box-containing protein